jgi:hypothetical protein
MVKISTYSSEEKGLQNKSSWDDLMQSLKMFATEEDKRQSNEVKFTNFVYHRFAAHLAMSLALAGRVNDS